MSIDLIPWARPQFEAGGGDALLFFALYGEFLSSIELSGETYRTAGVPEGIDIRKLNRSQTAEYPFTSGAIGPLLRPEQPDLFAQIRGVPECLIIQVSISAPPDLNYLRDTIGVATYFVDHGGVAIIDPQQFKLYAPEAWRKEIFQPQPPDLGNHVVILLSDEPSGGRWFHTRGLRKFGRPDLSMHKVPPHYERAVIEMFNHFILFQAEGGRIGEGENVRLPSLPPGLSCHHGGR